MKQYFDIFMKKHEITVKIIGLKTLRMNELKDDYYKMKDSVNNRSR